MAATDGSWPEARPTAAALDQRIVAGLHRLDDVPGALAELVALYVADGAGAMADLDTALGAGDRSAAGEAVHRLKGTSANLGAARVTAACIAVEGCLRAGADPAAAVAALRSAYLESCEALRAEFGRG